MSLIHKLGFVAAATVWAYAGVLEARRRDTENNLSSMFYPVQVAKGISSNYTCDSYFDSNLRLRYNGNIQRIDTLISRDSQGNEVPVGTVYLTFSCRRGLVGTSNGVAYFKNKLFHPTPDVSASSVSDGDETNSRRSEIKFR